MTPPQERTITVGQLRQNPTRMLSDVQDGETYTVTNHGRPIADVVPHRDSAWVAVDAVRELLAASVEPTWVEELQGQRGDADLRDPWA